MGVVLIGVLLTACTTSEVESDPAPVITPPSVSSNDTQSSSSVSSSTAQVSLTPKQEQDRLAIAQTIIGEAGGKSKFPNEWKQGQEAVAWVIINRAYDKRYPDDWYKIVTQNGQFNGYNQGKFWYENGKCDAVAWDYAYELAGYMVQGNYRNIPYPEGFNSDFTRFSKYVGQNGSGINIGGNYFYEG